MILEVDARTKKPNNHDITYKINNGGGVCDYENYENRQGVTGEGDQVMLMGRNCSHMVCKMGCHCGLMEGAA